MKERGWFGWVGGWAYLVLLLELLQVLLAQPGKVLRELLEVLLVVLKQPLCLLLLGVGGWVIDLDGWVERGN